MKSFKLATKTAVLLLALGATCRAQTADADAVPDVEAQVVSARDQIKKLQDEQKKLVDDQKKLETLAKADVDLTGQWKDSSRNQAFIGSCHIFASAGIVEAALYRKNGKQIHINENDLFLTSKILSPAEKTNAFMPYCTGASCQLEEGGWPSDDVPYLFNHGAAQVLNEDPLLRQDFVEQWGLYTGSVVDAFSKYDGRLQQEVKDGKLGVDQDSLCTARGQCADAQKKGPQIKQMIADIEQQAEVQDDRGLQAMRAGLVKQMSGLKLYVKRLPPYIDDLMVPKAPKGKCAESAGGKEIMNTLLAELKAGHPVAIDTNLQGLKSWVGDAQGAALHVFIIDGTKHSTPDDFVFMTRNSWGHNEVGAPDRPNNPDVTPDQLCRIMDMYVVLTGNEAGPATKGWTLVSR